MTEEPLCCRTFEYAIKDACCEAFFAQSMSMGKIEFFAGNIDEIACFVND